LDYNFAAQIVLASQLQVKLKNRFFLEVGVHRVNQFWNNKFNVKMLEEKLLFTVLDYDVD
jgi:hypothetical protein